MKKPPYLLLFLILIYSCGPKQDKVDKTYEIGTEVILNHIEPYRIKGEPNSFYLEEELVIDFERGDLSEFGISDIRGFDVDSEGNIYISNFLRKPEYFIYKFSGQGEFLTRFARFGQGPGEAQIVQRISIDNEDRLFTFENGGRKILVFDKDGGILTEIPYQWFQYDFVCLPNGSYLVTRNVTGERKISLSIHNHDLEKAKELEMVAFPNRTAATFWTVSENFIYVSDDKKGYEIRVYDFKGKLIRKIRKEHRLVKLPLEKRKSIEEIYKVLEKQTGEKIDPDIHRPPLSKYFVDSDERLYVQTWEEGDKPDEYIHDIFNRDGAFIGRVSLNIFVFALILSAHASNEDGIWKEFVTSLYNNTLTLEQIKSPYVTKEQLMEWLDIIKSRHAFDEMIAPPDIYKMDNKVQHLKTLTYKGHTTTYNFSFFLKIISGISAAWRQYSFVSIKYHLYRQNHSRTSLKSEKL